MCTPAFLLCSCLFFCFSLSFLVLFVIPLCSSFQIFLNRRKKEERGLRRPQRVANAEMMKSFLFSKDIPGQFGNAATQARLRSQSGAHAGDHLTALPTCEYTVATPERMNGMLRRRARLPLVTGHRRDAFGDYGAAWPRDGGLRRRGAAFERAFRPLWNS